MRKSTWFRTMTKWFANGSRDSRSARGSPSLKLWLEALEERCVPTTFTVLNNSDSGAGSLRAAITSANADTTADTIVFDPSLVGQTITLATALPNLTNNGLTITGLGATSLTVSGNNAVRVFDIAAGTTVTITGLTITGGSAGAAASGGGILNNGTLTLDSVTLTGNTAGVDGGGIDSTGAAPVALTITNSTIENNAATDLGGGIENDTNSVATLTNDVIINNSVTSGFGAGIFNLGQITITNTTISGNTALGAGGAGGGIGSTGQVSLIGSTVSSNVSQGQAGGIGSTGSLLDITNSTIANNTALGGSGGGGILIETTGNLSILNSTITGNIDASGAATNSGGISFNGTGTFMLSNTIVAQNLATASGPPDIRGAVASGSVNNFVGIGTAALTGITNGTNGNQIGTTAAPLNPSLGPLQDNGGATFTRAPLSGSLVINKGSNVAASTLTTDQRGFLRVVGTTVDIGAVEFQPGSVSTTLTISPVSPTPAYVAVTLVADVVPVTSSAAPNNPVTGTVTFLDGTTVLGTGTLDATGHASFTTTLGNSLPVGSDSITAVYEGDFNFNKTVSAPVVQTVIYPTTTAGEYDPTTANWTLSTTNTANGPDLPVFSYGAPGAGTIPIVGDWTGDGVFTVGVYTQATGVFQIRLSNTPGAPFVTFQFGTTDGAGIPVAGDWSGDGKWGIGVFDPTNGSWNLRNELSSGLPDAGSFLYGAPGSKPVVGDWTGSGKMTIGVIEPDGTWKLKNENTAGSPDFIFQYGTFADYQFVGDWTGDGVWTPGVVENDNGQATWKLRNENSAGAPDITPFVFGSVSQTPVIGSWVFP